MEELLDDNDLITCIKYGHIYKIKKGKYKCPFSEIPIVKYVGPLTKDIEEQYRDKKSYIIQILNKMCYKDLIIKSPFHVTIGKEYDICVYGKLIIEEGAKLTIEGNIYTKENVYNHGYLVIRGKLSAGGLLGYILEKCFDKTCIFCLEDLKTSNCLFMLNCKHAFHNKCYDLYNKKICPVCKKKEE